MNMCSTGTRPEVNCREINKSINDAQIQCVDKTPRDNYKEKENNKCSRSSSNYTLKC